MAATNPYPPGLGNDQQAMQATAAMRQEPWYKELLTSWGIDPEDTDENGNPRTKLTDDQRTQLMQVAISKGIGFNHKYDGIDENGQIIEEHHKLRKALIGAAIGGAALTGFGLAGMGPLAGLGGAGAAGGAGLGAAETATPFGVGGLSATSLGLPVTAGLGTAGATGGGVLSTIAGLAGKGSALSKLGGLFGQTGQAIGAASTAAGQNRLDQERLGLEAASIDAAQRRAALQDVARANMMTNPRVSPFDPVGAPKYSPQYTSTLQQLAQQGTSRLAQPSPTMTPATVQQATGTTPSTLSKISDWVSPALTITGSLAKAFA